MYNTSRWNKEIVDQTGARYISPCCDEGGWTRVGGYRKDKEVGRRLGFMYLRVNIEPALERFIFHYQGESKKKLHSSQVSHRSFLVWQ